MCLQAQTHKILQTISLLLCFFESNSWTWPIFPSSAYCLAVPHSAYCFLWLIFLLSFAAMPLWVSRLPVSFQNNSSCQPSFLSPISPLPPDPPSSSIHHSTAHFTVPLCLLPPSVSLAPLPYSLVSPSSHPLPVQPADRNSFYPLTVFPSLLRHFSSHHSSSGPLSISLSPSLTNSLSSSSSFVWQRSSSALADSAVCVNWVLSFTSPSPPIALHPPTTAASFLPYVLPSLPSFLLSHTFIPLQAGELTFQPTAAGLNDGLWGQLLTSGPHTPTHKAYIHKDTDRKL